MPQHGRKKANELLLTTLACGATVEVAAQKAGISRATAFRRLQDPAFQSQLQQLGADMVKRAAATLTAANTEAIKTLLSLVQPTVPPATRLGAARSILEYGLKMRETADLEERLKAIEERMATEGRKP
jgi:hypothetical protein